MNEIHEGNRACWNEWAQGWGQKADRRGTWRKCLRDPGLVLTPGEMGFLKDLKEKNVCVLGSGDNEVVFALAGMGASVTSVDISERQLEIAEERAGILGLDIIFMQADVIELTKVGDNHFDVVYTGGHFSVWISDIQTYYSEAVRVLCPGGLFIVNDYHPVRRMWHESKGPEPKDRYFNRGPYTYSGGENLTQTEFHWTTADHIQAVLNAGCDLVKVDEHGEGPEEGDYAADVPPALPMYLMIVGRKRPVGNANA